MESRRGIDQDRGIIGRVAGSSAIRVAAVYGASGVGFAGANLLLARTLPKADFGLFSLALAILYLSVPIAAAGADGILNRYPAPARYSQLSRVLATGMLFGGCVTLAARAVYELDPLISSLIFVGIVLGAGNFLASAHFQSRQHFPQALGLSQGANFVLLAVAVVATLLGTQNPRIPFGALVVWYAVAGTTGWVTLFRMDRSEIGLETDPPVAEETGTGDRDRFPWKEALSYAGVTGGYLALVQMERLVTPKLLDIETLATYAVLAAVAGSPFRILQQGVGYTMLPRLRAATSEADRRTIVREESLVIAAVATAAMLAIWFLARPIVLFIAGPEYSLGHGLILAALVSGIAKLASAFMSSLVTALGDSRDLAVLNGGGWALVAVGVAAAGFGSRYGLEGILYGVAFAWLGRSMIAGWLGVPRLGSPATVRT